MWQWTWAFPSLKYFANQVTDRSYNTTNTFILLQILKLFELSKNSATAKRENWTWDIERNKLYLILNIYRNGNQPRLLYLRKSNIFYLKKVYRCRYRNHSIKVGNLHLMTRLHKISIAIGRTFQLSASIFSFKLRYEIASTYECSNWIQPVRMTACCLGCQLVSLNARCFFKHHFRKWHNFVTYFAFKKSSLYQRLKLTTFVSSNTL